MFCVCVYVRSCIKNVDSVSGLTTISFPLLGIVPYSYVIFIHASILNMLYLYVLSFMNRLLCQKATQLDMS